MGQTDYWKKQEKLQKTVKNEGSITAKEEKKLKYSKKPSVGSKVNRIFFVKRIILYVSLCHKLDRESRNCENAKCLCCRILLCARRTEKTNVIVPEGLAINPGFQKINV